MVFLVLLYRQLRFGYPFRKIPLTKGKFSIVDPEDYHQIRECKWYAHKSPHTFYAVRSLTNGKRQKRKNAYMHHMVIDIPAGMYCDHINHNGLDNRKANLRPVTNAQNVWHRRKFIRRTPGGFNKQFRSKHKGVDWAKDMKRWRARIRVNGRRIYLGSFSDEIEAAKAYDQAACKYHKEFAMLNFPD